MDHTGAPQDAGVIDELTVKQIKVVEDDGTLRMIIGNSTHGRALPLRGELREHPGRNGTAGILFVNDEGTECGGLQFGGSQTDDGPHQVGVMTFDDYEQNESFRIGLFQRHGTSQRSLELMDQPSWSIVDFLDDLETAGHDGRAEVRSRYFADTPPGGISRIAIARSDDGAATIILRDGEGRDRIRLTAPASGSPSIEVLDETGDVHRLA